MITRTETRLIDGYSYKLGYVHVTGCFPYNVINPSHEPKITNRNRHFIPGMHKTGKMIQFLPRKAYKLNFNEKLIELKTVEGKDK